MTHQNRCYSGRAGSQIQPKHGVSALTAVSVPVSAMAVEAGGGSDLHLQLFALGGVGWHGVAVVRPQTALALSPHRLRQLIGCVRAGAPAAQARELRRDPRVSLTLELPWQQMGRGHCSLLSTQLCVGGVRLLKIHCPDFLT